MSWILNKPGQWLLTGISVTAMTLAAFHSKWGFALWVVSGIGWIRCWYLKGMKERLVLEVVYTVQSLFGFLYWWWRY